MVANDSSLSKPVNETQVKEFPTELAFTCAIQENPLQSSVNEVSVAVDPAIIVPTDNA